MNTVSLTPDLAGWLDHLGLVIPSDFGPWKISEARSAAQGQDEAAVVVTFRRGSNETQVWLAKTQPARDVFARTRHLDLWFSSVPKHQTKETSYLVRSFQELLKRLEPDDLPAPPRVEQTRQVTTDAYATASATEPNDAPERRAKAEDHFLNWAYADADRLDAHADALSGMFADKVGGLIIGNVFSPAEMQRVVEGLEARRTAFKQTFFPKKFQASFFGQCLDGSDPLLSDYLTEAERFRLNVRDAFKTTTGFEARVEQVLSRLSGGRPVCVPTYVDGRRYSPATIRVLPPGGQIGAHCGNEASGRPAYNHLNTIVDRSDQISYFVVMQAPESGGELVVYSLRWDDIDERHIIDGRTSVHELLEQSRWDSYSPKAGDMVVFDGGRYFHRVSVVEGDLTRWTIGGFAMLTENHEKVLFWS